MFQTFRFRHDEQACWTCRRFTGRPSASEATNLTMAPKGRFLLLLLLVVVVAVVLGWVDVDADAGGLGKGAAG